MSMSQKRKSDDEAPLSYPDLLSLVRWTKGTIDVFLSEKKKGRINLYCRKMMHYLYAKMDGWEGESRI